MSKLLTHKSGGSVIFILIKLIANSLKINGIISFHI